MGLTINIGGPNNESKGGSMSFSRQGVYSYVFVYGDQNHIETTIAEEDASVSGTLALLPNWDTTVTWDAALAKTQRTKYQDHYRRYSVDPDDANLNEIDVAKTVGGNSSPKGYREFKATLTRLTTPTVDATEPSASADVLVGGATWFQASDKGLTVGSDNNSNVPSILFNAKVATKNTTKDMDKAVVITMVGLSRLYSDNFVTGSNIETDFTPFLVVQKDRFRSTFVRESYRDNPAGSATSGTGADDSDAIEQYALNQNDTFGRLATGGGVELMGNAGVYNGDSVTTLNIYYNGAYVAKAVELLVVSRVYNFATDTTSIIFGRP